MFCKGEALPLLALWLLPFCPSPKYFLTFPLIVALDGGGVGFAFRS